MMSADKKIYVTQPYLPELNEFIPYLEKIWDNKCLTNNGPFHQQLEEELSKYLGVKYISLFANGTIALVTALQALRITGEVITTPYSFVATAHSLLWNGIKPVFADISKKTLNLDPEKIEEVITPETTAILPVHCYGNICDVEKIQEIANNYNLKVIYDAAHAFGVKDEGGSILRYGDLSILSFHATKVYNTFEGGAIISSDLKTKQYIDNLKNFGFVNETTVVASGINGKMSEVNAAFGLLQLKHIDKIILERKKIEEIYREELKNIKGLSFIQISENIYHNASYFPVFINSEYIIKRDELYDRLKQSGIYSRRYFYPLISDMQMYRKLSSASAEKLNNAQQISKSVLCLPIYPGLRLEDQKKIIEIIKNPTWVF